MSTPPARASAYDVLIVGGGLAGQLCVLALAKRAPGLRVALVERDTAIGGNHTWCCHGTDLAHPAVDAGSLDGWFSPLVDRRWGGHHVRFPGYQRTLDGNYLCLRSTSLAVATERTLARTGGALLAGRDVAAVDTRSVELATGEQLTGRLVLDARGATAADFQGRCGYQKFIGWELELARPLATVGELPILMDATVAQLDGYRFVYTLPFSPTRALIEDTYFSRSPEFDGEAARTRLHAHLHASGITSFTRVREELGVLPMPWAAPEVTPSALAIGYRGGFFHPGTGYSLPRAAVVAERIAAVVSEGDDDLPTAVARSLGELRASWEPSDRFARLLNQLAFRLVPEAWLRDAVFARVYRLAEPLLARFYAGRTTRRDRLALAAAPLRLPLSAARTSHAPLLGELP